MKSKVYCRAHKNQPIVRIVSQINPVHALPELCTAFASTWSQDRAVLREGQNGSTTTSVTSDSWFANLSQSKDNVPQWRMPILLNKVEDHNQDGVYATVSREPMSINSPLSKKEGFDFYSF